METKYVPNFISTVALFLLVFPRVSTNVTCTFIGYNILGPAHRLFWYPTQLQGTWTMSRAAVHFSMAYNYRILFMVCQSPVHRSLIYFYPVLAKRSLTSHKNRFIKAKYKSAAAAKVCSTRHRLVFLGSQ